VSSPGHDFHGRSTNRRKAARSDRARDATRFVAPLGRLLLVAIFLLSAPLHFTRDAIPYAAMNGVPFARFAVPLSGLIALAGGLSVLIGYHAKAGAWLLVLFLVPVTLMMHAFWRVPDPTFAVMQQIMFMKNVAILGGVLMIAHFGAGPVSYDASHG
jgi:putative oxidoreductase